MNANLKFLKMLFPDYLSLLKELKHPKSENIKLFNDISKTISEDRELLKRLAK